MRVTENDPRAHRDELVDEEQPVLEHFLEDQHGSLRLRRDGESDRRQVGWERRPRPVLDLGDLTAEIVLDDEFLARRHAQSRPVELDPNAQPLERRQDRRKILGDDVVDRHVAGGHRREADEARDLDVLAGDPPLAAP